MRLAHETQKAQSRGTTKALEEERRRGGEKDFEYKIGETQGHARYIAHEARKHASLYIWRTEARREQGTWGIRTRRAWGTYNTWVPRESNLTHYFDSFSCESFSKTWTWKFSQKTILICFSKNSSRNQFFRKYLYIIIIQKLLHKANANAKFCWSLFPSTWIKIE